MPTVNIKFPFFALSLAILVATTSPVRVTGQTAQELAQYTGLTLPKPETVPGVVVLKTRANQGFNIQSTAAIEKLAMTMGAQSVRKLLPGKNQKTPFGGGATTYVLQFSPSADVSSIVDRLANEQDITYIEPAYIFKLFGRPNDTDFQKQLYLSQSQLGEILAIPANHDVTVAVIDTGIDTSHPDLQGHIIGGYNFLSTANAPIDDQGHGTHIAGIIGARINNKLGTVGLNPRSKILNLKIASGTGFGSQVAAADAIRYAVDNGAKIINCSWGYFVYNQVLKDAVEYALSQGVIVIAAMGNDGNSLKQFPAGFPGVTAVGAIDSKLNYASFSNVGDHIAFVENGVDILSTAPGGKTASLTGTSQSTAILSGIASRILSYNPRLTGQEVGTIMLLSAEPIADGQRSANSGNGYIVAEKLFRSLNIPSANGFITEEGALAEPANTDDPPQKSDEAFWLTILLFPYRIIEFLFGGLI